MQFLSEVMQLSPGTVILISIGCGIGVLVLMDMLPNPMLGFAMLPVTILTSMSFMQLMIRLELFASRAFDAWLLLSILSSAVGMAVGLIVAVLVGRLSGRMTARRHNALAPRLRVRHVRLGNPAENG